MEQYNRAVEALRDPVVRKRFEDEERLRTKGGEQARRKLAKLDRTYNPKKRRQLRRQLARLNKGTHA